MTKRIVSTSGDDDRLEQFMRAGFIAKGIIYMTIGLLAFRAAIGTGGRTTGQRGTLAAIARQPFGQILLLFVAVGLVGLMIWYVLRGVRDTDHAGDDLKGRVKRAGYVVAGLLYGVLALLAVQVLLGNRSGGGGSASDWTARVMRQPLGRVAIAALGVAIGGVGLFQLYRAYEAQFMQHLKTSQMSAAMRKWGRRAGQFGYGARSVVYALIGGFLVQAALRYNPEQAGGIGQALEALARQPFGPWLLGVVALGLLAYGLFAAVFLFRYRRVES